MTPKEKAKELVSLFKNTIIFFDDDIDSKKCAIMVCNEVLKIRYLLKKETWFYKEVKKEINKL